MGILRSSLALHSLAPTGCSEKPSLHCSQFTATTSAPWPPAAFSLESSDSCSFQSAATDHQRAPAKDTSSEITTKDFKEKKAFAEEAENGRDTPANGNANEENGEQEADNEVVEEEEEGGEEEEEEGDGEEEDGDEDEEAEAATGKWSTEDDEDDNVDTKKQKTDEDD
ncbi:Prothymosin alpha [Vulpes lagopus]